MQKAFDFNIGDTIQVYQTIREGEKTRTQIFEGIVTKVHGRGQGKMFTVRKFVGPIAVERIWAHDAPLVQQIKVKSKAKKLSKIHKI